MHILEKKTYVKPSVAVLGLVEEGYLCANSKGQDETNIPVGPTESTEESLIPPKDESGCIGGE